MKLLVVSDIHGRHDRLSVLLDMHKNADALIFLGDGLRDLERADAYSRGMSVISVKGNCDGTSFLGNDAPTEQLQTIGGYKMLMLHGHTRGVKSGMERAILAAVQSEADILLFGHTHIPMEKYIPESQGEGILSLPKPLRIFNPGSLGASGDGRGHFGLIEIRGKDILMSHGMI